MAEISGFSAGGLRARAIECELYDGVDYGGCVSAKGCGLQEGYHCPP